MIIPLALFVSAALALWLATLIQRRPAGPAISSAVWMLVGVAIWCTTSAFHGLVDTLELKIFWSKVQYAGMVSVPPLWFLFAAEYSGASWEIGRAHV